MNKIHKYLLNMLIMWRESLGNYRGNQGDREQKKNRRIEQEKAHLHSLWKNMDRIRWLDCRTQRWIRRPLPSHRHRVRKLFCM